MPAVPYRVVLPESQLPTQWYNLVPDLPEPPPSPLHPGTREPVGPADLAPLFPMALIEQEVSTEQYVDIPGGVLDVYRIWRPSPLVRARRLEKLLDTPAKIFFKYEGVSPAGSASGRPAEGRMIAVVSSNAPLADRSSSQPTRQAAADTKPIRIRVSRTSPKMSPPVTVQYYLAPASAR